MSTKIHTGVVFSNPSIDAIIAEAPMWRKRIEALTAIAKAEWLAARAIKHFDARHLGETAVDSPLSRAWQDYREDVANELKGLRHPDTDFEFQISLMPFEGHLYGIVRTERFRWFEEYASRPGISRYEYWNNSEQPKEIDAAAWNERDRVWSGALREYQNLTLDYSSDRGPPSDAEIAAAMPSFKHRLDRAARDRTTLFYMREVANVPADAGVNEHVSALTKSFDWLGTEAGQNEFNRERARLEKILPRDVTVEMLRAAAS